MHFLEYLSQHRCTETACFLFPFPSFCFFTGFKATVCHSPRFHDHLQQKLWQSQAPGATHREFAFHPTGSDPIIDIERRAMCSSHPSEYHEYHRYHGYNSQHIDRHDDKVNLRHLTNRREVSSRREAPWARRPKGVLGLEDLQITRHAKEMLGAS